MIIPSSTHGLIASGRQKIITAGGDLGDFIPDSVDWGNLSAQESTGECGVSSKQITGINTSMIITTNWTANNGGNIYLYYRVDNSQPSFGYPQTTGFTVLTQSGLQITVNNNQWVSYLYCGSFSGVTVTVKNASNADTVLDTFQCDYVSACFLTSTVVKYFNLEDDGPELTAMRALRNYYKNISGYNEILSEYSTISASIISGIEHQEDNNRDLEYTYIYNTVIAVMNHVNAEEWEQAHDLYMAMYMDLKARYVG